VQAACCDLPYGWMFIADESDAAIKFMGRVSVLFSGLAIPLGIKKSINNDDALPHQSAS